MGVTDRRSDMTTAREASASNNLLDFDIGSGSRLDYSRLD